MSFWSGEALMVQRVVDPNGEEEFKQEQSMNDRSMLKLEFIGNIFRFEYFAFSLALWEGKPHTY